MHRPGVIFLVFGLAPFAIVAYPTGFIDSCPTAPGHGNGWASGSGSYSLSLQSFLGAVSSYSPGVQYSLVLSSSSASFRGFVLAGFPTSAPQQWTDPHIGTIVSTQATTQVRPCRGLAHRRSLLSRCAYARVCVRVQLMAGCDGGATHTNNNDKTTITVGERILHSLAHCSHDANCPMPDLAL
jgi:hypothetical protein